ncbi:mCG1028439, partial [Mus musculus]
HPGTSWGPEYPARLMCDLLGSRWLLSLAVSPQDAAEGLTLVRQEEQLSCAELGLSPSSICGNHRLRDSLLLPGHSCGNFLGP